MTPHPNLTYEADLPNKEERMRELIVYISDKCAGHPRYGATMLNKILWAVDFISFQNRGVPITGEKYQRLERGPAPLRVMPIRRQLETDGDIHVRTVKYPVGTQHRIVALRSADLSIFSGEEIALVDTVINSLTKMNSDQVSEWSHIRAWKTRYDHDLLPYESIFLSDEPVTVGDISRTEELARKFNWHAYTCST